MPRFPRCRNRTGRNDQQQQQQQQTHGFAGDGREWPPENPNTRFNGASSRPGGSYHPAHHHYGGFERGTRGRGRGGRRGIWFGGRLAYGHHHGGGGRGRGHGHRGHHDGGDSDADEGPWHQNNDNYHQKDGNSTKDDAQPQQTARIPMCSPHTQTLQRERGQQISQIKSAHRYGRQLKPQIDHFLRLLETLLTKQEETELMEIMEMDWEFTGAVLYFPTQDQSGSSTCSSG